MWEFFLYNSHGIIFHAVLKVNYLNSKYGDGTLSRGFTRFIEDGDIVVKRLIFVRKKIKLRVFHVKVFFYQDWFGMLIRTSKRFFNNIRIYSAKNFNSVSSWTNLFQFNFSCNIHSALFLIYLLRFVCLFFICTFYCLFISCLSSRYYVFSNLNLLIHNFTITFLPSASTRTFYYLHFFLTYIPFYISRVSSLYQRLWNCLFSPKISFSPIYSHSKFN